MSASATPQQRHITGTGMPLQHCPRCTGNLFLSDDNDQGPEWTCLQCGRTFPATPLSEDTAYRPAKRRAA